MYNFSKTIYTNKRKGDKMGKNENIEEQPVVENLNNDEVVIESFKQYDEADDGITKKVDGELEIESFHLYESGEEE